MGDFTFYRACAMLREIGEPPGIPPGGPGGGLGGPPGGLGGPPGMGGGGMPPMGGGGMPAMGGGMPPMGAGGIGDPMGGGMQGQPIPIKTVSAADVWGILEKIVKDEKSERFFDEINVNKEVQSQMWKQPKKQSSLYR